MGPKTAFVSVGGRGSYLADSRLPFEAASLGRLWINVTLGRFRRFALPFLPFTEFEVDPRPNTARIGA